MMCVASVRLGHDPQKLLLDFERCLAGGEAGAVGDPKNVGIDRNGRLAESDVEDHVCGFAANPRQRF